MSISSFVRYPAKAQILSYPLMEHTNTCILSSIPKSYSDKPVSTRGTEMHTVSACSRRGTVKYLVDDFRLATKIQHFPSLRNDVQKKGGHSLHVGIITIENS